MLRRALSLSAVLLAAACTKDPPPAPARSDNVAPAKPSAHIAGDNYRVDTQSSCADGECTAMVRVEATGEYHINDAYPYKLTANAADGVTFEGKDPSGANVFSKASGDFAKQGEKVGVMTLKMKAAKAQTVTGTFKMSVCSAANCQLEQQTVATTITVR
jgi:hypothetical protein